MKAVMCIYFCLFLVLLGKSLAKSTEGVNGNDNNADYYENTEHSFAHKVKVVNECHGIELYAVKHCVFSFQLLHEEVEDKTACDNRCNLTRYVYAYRVHEKEVLIVFSKSQLVNNTS